MEPEIYAQVAVLEKDHWWYRGRRLVCRSVLEDHLGFNANRRILDVGCGTGYNLAWLRRWGEVHGVEPSEDALKECHLRGCHSVIQASAEALPYPDEHFDLVSAFDIIEHIQDDVAALKEMRRVLRPGGYLLIYTPALPWLYGEHDRRVHHWRRYRASELREKLSQANLEPAFFSSVNLLILPLVMLAKFVYDRIPGRPHSEMRMPSWPVNFCVYCINAVEAAFLRHFPLPYGMSIVCLARRPGQA